MIRSKLVSRLAIAVLLIGVAVLGTAVIQPIKSELGLTLLDRTFTDRLAATPLDQADAEQWRPWPWADLAPIGELHFPDLNESRVVVDSASGEALAWGVGHMPETAELGAPGIAVVAGHRDGSFALLGQVHEGDVVELTTLTGETAQYVIQERRVVDSLTEQLPIVHAGPQELFLTTCWPIDGLISGPDRLLLRATPLT